MRTTIFAILGLISGALVGIAAAFLLVAIWYDVLGYGAQGGDGLSGLSSFMALALLLGLGGGAGGAIWLARRAGGGGRARWVAPAIVVALLVVVLGRILFVGMI
ncbi:MAG: hypothetical protein KF780_07065 [Sphingomonas sp.]|nr:hypothetical protein [Sphingomonas sp.]